MAATFFGYAIVPTTDDGTNTADPTAIAPPGSMAAGDLVILWATARTGSATLAISQAGGQSWNTEDSATSTNITSRLFWCRFNGSWSANPSVSFGATTCNSVSMLVFRPSTGANLWAMEQAESVAAFAAAATITITGQTTGRISVAVALWSTVDNNTWGSLSGTGWIKTSLPAQNRNSSGQDTSQTWAYQIQTAAGATNNVSQTEATLGNDLGVAAIACFYEYAALTMNSASLSSACDNVVLAQAHTLQNVAACSLSHESSTPTLNELRTLAVQAAVFGHQSDLIGLLPDWRLTMSSAAFDHGSDNIDLVPGAGATLLEPSPASLSLQADGDLLLFQAHVLAVDSASLSSASAGPVLVPDWRLDVGSASLSHEASGPVLLTTTLLEVAAAAISSASDVVDLVQQHTLAVDAASLSSISDNIGLVTEGSLSVQSAALESASSNIDLFQAHTLAVSSASLDLAAEAPTLGRGFVLEVQGAELGSSADSPALAQQHVLEVASAALALAAESVLLYAPTTDSIVVQSAVVGLASQRIFMLESTEKMLHSIDVDPRPLVHTVEPRRLTVDVEPRSLVHTVEPRERP